MTHFPTHVLARLSRAARPAFMVYAMLSLMACDAATDGAATVDATVDAAPSDASVVPPVSSRNARYCEVLPIYLEAGTLHIDVWNTIAFNDCPQAEWEALDATTIATELGALQVLMNGPRYFLMDDATALSVPSDQPRMFGNLMMSMLATLELDPAAATQNPYTEKTVNRDTEFTFWIGSEIYELVGPDGAEYVMQAYALIVDPALTIDDLPLLSSRLALPTGWQYRVRTLTEPLVVRSVDGQVTVVQDELQNTYSLHTPPVGP